jgi:hypothetical protein
MHVRLVVLAVFLTARATAAAEEPPQIACPAGMSVTPDTLGHCCWPGQVWSAPRLACVGVPTCPPQLHVEGEACLAKAAGQPSAGDGSASQEPAPGAPPPSASEPFRAGMTQTSVAPPPPNNAKGRVGGWVVIGLGLACAAGGAVSGSIALDHYNAAEHATDLNTFTHERDAVQLPSLVADTLYATAAVGLIVGVAVLYSYRDRPVSVSVAPSSGGGSVVLSGSF